MMPPMYRCVIADVQRAAASPHYDSWGLVYHMNWYYHCKSRGPEFFHKRWGNHKAAVSRNKREGKYRIQWVRYSDDGSYTHPTHRRVMGRGLTKS